MDAGVGVLSEIREVEGGSSVGQDRLISNEIRVESKS